MADLKTFSSHRSPAAPEDVLREPDIHSRQARVYAALFVIFILFGTLLGAAVLDRLHHPAPCSRELTTAVAPCAPERSAR